MTKPILLSVAITLLSAFSLTAQKIVDVIESTLKVGLMGEEIFYYGFAAGDQLVFHFEEVNGKEMKEIEIVEMPSTTRFMDYKSKKIENKTIAVPKTGIYKFRFTNAALGIRMCKYKIQRIPANSATQNFNTTVYYRMTNDTTYTTEEEDFLAKTDTVIINLNEQSLKVGSVADAAGNKASFTFTLPEKTIAWSYYISTGEGGEQIYKEAMQQVSAAGGPAVAKYKNYTPLAAVAMNAPSYLTKLQTGDDIDYWIVEGENADLFMNKAPFRFMKKGKVFNAYGRMEYRKGGLYFCFANDNPGSSVNLTVKITAIQVNDALAKRPIQRIVTTPRKEMYLQN
ncbi:MAG TPA: hypothetical protein VF487_09980 [Chitinophagaceae bacterium]